MPQSLSAVYIHLVFSTKERYPFLQDQEINTRLHQQLGGISKRLECPPLIIGGVSDHVHLLCRFGRTITQAEWVKELKRVSNLWLKDQGGFDKFAWQGGYADFSVSYSNLGQVQNYIANQESHHRKRPFKMKFERSLVNMRSLGMRGMFGTKNCIFYLAGRNPDGVAMNGNLQYSQGSRSGNPGLRDATASRLS